MNETASRIQKLALRRGPCYGNCPVYEVIASADGTVKWRGGFFVTVAGVASWSIDASRIAEIERALQQAEFRGAEDSYPMPTDSPVCEVSVTFEDGCSKAVKFCQRAFRATKKLDELVDRVDVLLGTHAYIGGRVADKV